MKKKLLIIETFFLFTFCVYSQSINTNLTTVSFDVKISSAQIPKAEVGSYMDTENKTHIAWIEDTGADRYLMYSVFDPVTNNISTTQIDAGESSENKIAPYIVTDINSNPHIVYFIKRDPSIYFNSGNFAVMYAGDGDGDGVFEVLQVSTNSTDPQDDSENIFNCYINGRPNIFFDNGSLIVSYFSDGSSINSYDGYFIFAKKSGDGWIYSQEFNDDEDMGSYYAPDGVSFPVQASSNYHAGYNNSGGFMSKARFMYKINGSWFRKEITESDNGLDNQHIQVEKDYNGIVHYLWYNRGGYFCHTILTEDNYGSVIEYPIEYSLGGNFNPATVDLTTGDPIFVYARAYDESRYLVVPDESNQTEEIEIEDIGSFYGRECFHVNNGYLSLVTASSTKIYITTNEASQEEAPVADFSANVTTITEGNTVTFTDLSTNSPTSWNWDFGDGGTSIEPNPEYVYNTAGVYTVSLTVSNAQGSDTETKTNYITVGGSIQAPEAIFSASPTTLEEGGTVVFSDLSLNNPTSWSWDFGDGGTSIESNPEYVYNTSGIYSVSLTVSNAQGSDTETKTDYITVIGNSGGETGTVTDYDGNTYNTIKIGDQWWMAENMKATHYADGTSLIDGSDAGITLNDYTNKYYFWYNNDISHKETYGALYNWAAVMNGSDVEESQGVCPNGWYVPSDNDWMVLEAFLGMDQNQTIEAGYRGSDEGGKLKEPGNTHWLDPNEGATNESGFTAIPEGFRNNDGTFSNLTVFSSYWTSTEETDSTAWRRYLKHEYSTIGRSTKDKTHGRAVRCIKGESTTIQPIKDKENLTIYPNPSNGLITLITENCINTKTEILNLTGQVVHSFIITSDEHRIDVRNLSKGLYIIKANNGRKIISGKFIIN